jgi:hypothetical protein
MNFNWQLSCATHINEPPCCEARATAECLTRMLGTVCSLSSSVSLDSPAFEWRRRRESPHLQKRRHRLRRRRRRRRGEGEGGGFISGTLNSVPTAE